MSRPPIRVAARVTAALVALGATVAAVGLSRLAGAQTGPGRVTLPQHAPEVPPGAVVNGPLGPSQPLSIDLALSVPDPGAMAAFAAAVSTPGSPDYGHYLAPGAFASRFGPAPSSVSAVADWLAGQGLTVGRPLDGGLLIPAHGPAAAVGAAFATTFDQVELPARSGAPGPSVGYANTAPPSVPSAVAGMVRGVVGLDDLSRPRPLFVRGQATASLAPPQACPLGSQGAGPGGALTFGQLASIYGASPLYPQGRTGAGITVALLELEPVSLFDLATFESCYGVSPSLGIVSVDGGPTGSDTTESVLDLETVAALAPQANLVDYQGPNDENGMIDVFAQMASDDRAQVISTSWGNCELENNPPNDPPNAAAIEDTIFAQMAMQGQTVVAASGDSGAQACWPAPINPADLTTVNADDPASQRYVTGVGGTALPNGSTVGETVWNDCLNRPGCAQNNFSAGASGGGVSREFAMPSYQSDPAAEARGTLGPDSSGQPCQAAAPGASLCREVPDVAADAAPSTGPIVYVGGWTPIGGTSVAAPIWGSLFALADQGCATPVGFANPKLYQLGAATSAAFNDVTTGNNDLLNNNGGNFAARTGYDMSTGWGSPDAAVLLSSLQPPGGCPAVTGLSATTAEEAGATLTISGTSLAGATAVHVGAANVPVLSDNGSSVTVALPPSPGPGAVDVTVTTPNGTSAVVPADRFVFPRTGRGYWQAASDGGLFAFGNAGFFGSMGGQPLNQPVVGLSATPDNRGYWEVASDGGLFAFGDAGFFGSMGGRPLNRPIVGMAPTGDGQGYWEVASDGGLFAFGDAGFFGSIGGRPLNQPIVGMAATADGKGYWEVASDGGLFAFGDAGFFGSMGGRPLNQPIVGMAATPDGKGYWEVASDGGLFAFGDAGFFGSMGGRPLNRPIVGMATT